MLSLRGLMERMAVGRASLPARIAVISMLPAITLVVLVGGLSIWLRFHDLDAGLRQRGLLLARQLASASDYGVFSGNSSALQSLAQSVAGERGVAAVQIRARDGRVLASVGATPQAAAAARRESGSIADASGRWITFVEPIRSGSIPLQDISEQTPAVAESGTTASPRPGVAPSRGSAVVVLSTSEVRSESLHFAGQVIAILGVVLCVTGVFARRMGRRISEPVFEVAHAVARIGRGEAGVRITPSPIGVLDLLGRGINEMAQRLERSMNELEHRVSEATTKLLEKKEEAEAANRAKSRFLAAASHDLRQPMHALGMFVAALSQQPSIDLQRRLIAQIERAVGALGDLLDSLLDISRLDAGVIEPRIDLVALQPLFDRLSNEFEAPAKIKGLDLVVRKSTAWVRTDRILLERILTNLLSNAIRYTEHGRVFVGARVCGPDRAHLRIEVRDSGIGIAPEARESIFQEFVQLANPERDRSKGLGLGLAIVKRLVALLGHRLELRSAPGAGSTFAVVAPLVPPTVIERVRVAHVDTRRARSAHPRATSAVGVAISHTSRLPPSSAPSSPTALPQSPGESGSAEPSLTSTHQPLQGRRILVVDDDPMVRESLAAILIGWGAKVALSAGPPSLPVQLREVERPDLVLCDLRLGAAMDGTQMLAAIRQALGARIPAVLITGDTDPERVALAKRSGDPVLHKPVRPAQLRAVLHRQLAGTRAGLAIRR